MNQPVSAPTLTPNQLKLQELDNVYQQKCLEIGHKETLIRKCERDILTLENEIGALHDDVRTTRESYDELAKAADTKAPEAEVKPVKTNGMKPKRTRRTRAEMEAARASV